MFGIPGPPSPQWSGPVTCGVAGGCLLLGLAMLLWGRTYARAVVCIAGIAGGLALAGPVAQRFDLHPTLVRVVGMVTLGLVGLVLARLTWALLAGALFGLAAECILLGRMSADQRPAFEAWWDGSLAGWAGGLLKFSMDAFVALWNDSQVVVLVAVGCAFVLPVIVALLRDRLARVFMTSLLGAAAAVLGPIFAAAGLGEALWSGIWRRWYVPAAVAAALMMFGLIHQYRGAMRADRSKDDREAEPPGAADTEPNAKTRKKN